MTRAADWLISKEVRRKGDWSVKRPDTEPSGWAFEFANEFYPDIDDTAMVLLALMHAKASDPKAQAAAERRAINWLLAMQSDDGGWAAFDVDNNWAVLNQRAFRRPQRHAGPHVPGHHRPRAGMPVPPRHGRVTRPSRRGVAYLLQAQEKDGSWYGRWGVNYIYGTFLAMRGLAASGAAAGRSDAMARAAEWLRGDPERRWRLGRILRQLRSRRISSPRRSCPSQTAWAILGLRRRRRARKRARCGAGCSSCWTARAPKARGRRTPPRAPASPTFST